MPKKLQPKSKPRCGSRRLLGSLASGGRPQRTRIFLPQRCILTADQLRAARAMLRMDQSALAAASGVSVETIERLERTEGPLSETPVATVNAIQGALEKAGVEFTNGNQPGVRRKSSGGSIPVEELNASNDD